MSKPEVVMLCYVATRPKCVVIPVTQIFIMELNLRLFFAIVFLRLNQMLIVNVIFYVIQLIVS